MIDLEMKNIKCGSGEILLGFTNHDYSGSVTGFDVEETTHH
jgi:imidazole glycerol phosphate synthase subunit HisF